MLKRERKRKMRSDFKSLQSVLLSIALISTLTLAFVSLPASAPIGNTYEKFGPRVDNILIKIYQGRDAEFGAFKTGEVDIIDWPVDFDTYIDLTAHPDEFVPYDVTSYDMYNLEMNCINWPTSDVNVRRAIAYVVNKELFFTTQLKSFSGSLMDTPIASEWTTWYNDFTEKYAFNRATAAQVLLDGGYYDDDSDGVREYHNATGSYELTPLLFYIRNDDPDRLAFGRDYVLPELLALGLPVASHVAPKTVCWEEVMRYPYNYHLYTGGWGPWIDPDYLYDMYHSKFGIEWYEAQRDWCNNYVFFTNSTFDDWAEQLKFAPTKGDAILPSMKCQEILMDQVPMVPGWHTAGAYATSKNYVGQGETYTGLPWVGMVNTTVISGMGNAGVNGFFSFLNAHPEGYERGGTIRYGFMTPADVFNPIHADFYWDWEVLNKVYDFLISANPVDAAGVDIPWMAKSWTTETWDNAGQPATKFTFQLYDNILWHDNVKFTAHDVNFTLYYHRAAFSPLFYPYVLDLHHCVILDDYTIEVYYGVQSVWALHWVAGLPVIPKHIWENIPPELSRTQGEFETTGKLTGSGPFRFVSESPQSILLTANPTYFRKLVRPDYYSVGEPIPTHDTDVDGDDFGMAVGHFGCFYPWPHPDRDPWCDVNKDLIVDIDDVMEIGVRYLKTKYYPYWQGYPNYYAP